MRSKHRLTENHKRNGRNTATPWFADAASHLFSQNRPFDISDWCPRGEGRSQLTRRVDVSVGLQYKLVVRRADLVGNEFAVLQVCAGTGVSQQTGRQKTKDKEALGIVVKNRRSVRVRRR